PRDAEHAARPLLRAKERIRLRIEGGCLAVEEDVMDVVAMGIQAKAENTGDFLRAGAFGLGLHEDDPRLGLGRGRLAVSRVSVPRGFGSFGDAGDRHDLLSRRRRMAAGHPAKLIPGDGSRPTRRRHATVSATAIATAEMLQAKATPRRPYAGPRVTNRRK